MLSVRETRGAVRTASGTADEWNALQSEHAALGVCAEGLEGLLGSLVGGPSTGPARSEVQRLLADFRGRLFEHLASEEQQGILERAAAVEPRLARPIERLRGDHRDLREQMDALVAEVAELAWVDVGSRFFELCHALRAHERAENEMLQQAYLDDIGGRG